VTRAFTVDDRLRSCLALSDKGVCMVVGIQQAQ
jgi:hypothetical protein